jgi:tRNA(Ile)-lysidine synthase
VLDAAVSAALEELGGGPAVSLAGLAEHPAAVRRALLRRLAERAARERLEEAADGQAPRALSRREADEILALGEHGTRSLDLGGGLRAVVEYGRLRFDHGPPPPPPPVRLTVPGAVAFGAGCLTCELAADGPLDAAALAPELEVRPWRPGDRVGSRTLQDHFTDRKIPRERRHQLPVVVSDGEIAWVAGIATAERFAAGPATRERVRLRWDA